MRAKRSGINEIRVGPRRTSSPTAAALAATCNVQYCYYYYYYYYCSWKRTRRHKTAEDKTILVFRFGILLPYINEGHDRHPSPPTPSGTRQHTGWPEANPARNDSPEWRAESAARPRFYDIKIGGGRRRLFFSQRYFLLENALESRKLIFKYKSSTDVNLSRPLIVFNCCNAGANVKRGTKFDTDSDNLKITDILHRHSCPNALGYGVRTWWSVQTM